MQPLQVVGDGPFAKVRIWYQQFFNPLSRAREFQSRVNGTVVTRGTSSAPWAEVA